MRKKNIVLIMYNFPPIGAGRGIAWTFFSDIISNDYNIDVITIYPSKNDPIYNDSKYKMISNNYQVRRTNPGMFYTKIYSKKPINKVQKNQKSIKQKIIKLGVIFYKKLLRTLLFPDRMIFWNKYAYKEYLKIREEKQIDLVITVGFPFSTHMLGKKIKEKFGGKLILDYGDPWCFNPSNETIPNWRRNLDFIIEKKVVKTADYITVTTNATADKLRNIFKLENKVGVIQQGVDNSIYKEKIKNKVKNINKNKLVLFYSGIFYEDIRNPKNFFEGLSLLKDTDLKGVKLEVIIAGKMEDYVFNLVDNYIYHENISIKFIGNIPLDKVIEYQVSCDFLLYFGNKGELQVPGKLYEYIAAQRPIFAIAPIYDEACTTIIQTNRGIVVNDIPIDIKNSILKLINNDENQNNQFNLEAISDFDWNVIGNKYKQIIDEVLEVER